MRAALIVLGVLAGAAPAAADDEVEPAELPAPPRRMRVSMGGGGSFLLTGDGELGRNRLDGHVELMPGGGFGRYGLLLAARHVVFDPPLDDALLTAGVVYEAAAARPRLTVALHADAGLALTGLAPALGGGVETHLWIVPKYLPIALVLDVTGHFIVDGVDASRLVLATATRLSIAF